jgi:hypothetical protein
MGMIWPASTRKLAFEHRSENAFLPPDFAWLQVAVGSQAGHLGAGSGAAWGAVVGLAGAENEVAAVVGRVVGGAEQLDVVDLRAVGAGDAARCQSWRISQAKAVRGFHLVEKVSFGKGMIPTRKNQLPPQATSPVTGP